MEGERDISHGVEADKTPRSNFERVRSAIETLELEAMAKGTRKVNSTDRKKLRMLREKENQEMSTAKASHYFDDIDDDLEALRQEIAVAASRAAKRTLLNNFTTEKIKKGVLEDESLLPGRIDKPSYRVKLKGAREFYCQRGLRRIEDELEQSLGRPKIDKRTRKQIPSWEWGRPLTPEEEAAERERREAEDVEARRRAEEAAEAERVAREAAEATERGRRKAEETESRRRAEEERTSRERPSGRVRGFDPRAEGWEGTQQYIELPATMKDNELKDWIDGYLHSSVSTGTEGINTNRIEFIRYSVLRGLPSRPDLKRELLLRIDSFKFLISAHVAQKANNMEAYESSMVQLSFKGNVIKTSTSERLGIAEGWTEMQERMIINYDRPGVQSAINKLINEKFPDAGDTVEGPGSFFRIKDEGKRNAKRLEIMESLRDEIKAKRAGLGLNTEPTVDSKGNVIDDVKADQEIAMKLAESYLSVFGFSARFTGPIKETRDRDGNVIKRELLEIAPNDAKKNKEGKITTSARKWDYWDRVREAWKSRDKGGNFVITYDITDYGEVPVSMRQVQFLPAYLELHSSGESEWIRRCALSYLPDLGTYNGFRGSADMRSLNGLMDHIRKGKRIDADGAKEEVFDPVTISSYATAVKKVTENVSKIMQFVERPLENPNEALYADGDKLRSAVAEALKNCFSAGEFFSFMRGSDRREAMQRLIQDALVFVNMPEAKEKYHWKGWNIREAGYAALAAARAEAIKSEQVGDVLESYGEFMGIPAVARARIQKAARDGLPVVSKTLWDLFKIVVPLK